MPENILSPRELRRYSRQIMIPEIGTEGQEKLKRSRVLIVGAGGLGCPVLQYLAAAGAGKIAIVEFDMVDESNLQRQILYGSDDMGKLKAIIAKNRLESLNSLIDIEIFNLRLDASNSIRIIKNFDIVVDATDNIETRYVIDDACAAFRIPMIHGAIYKFEGEVSVFNYNGGQPYRSFNPPSDRTDFRNPKPADVGLLGVLPGITGTFMANEAIKIITGIRGVLSGSVLIFNILDYSFHIVKLK
jgi:adenylyltransferase/sulfurtransferase